MAVREDVALREQEEDVLELGCWQMKEAWQGDVSEDEMLQEFSRALSNCHVRAIIDLKEKQVLKSTWQ